MFDEMLGPEFIGALSHEDESETDAVEETPCNCLDDDVGWTPGDATSENESHDSVEYDGEET